MARSAGSGGKKAARAGGEKETTGKPVRPTPETSGKPASAAPRKRRAVAESAPPSDPAADAAPSPDNAPAVASTEVQLDQVASTRSGSAAEGGRAPQAMADALAQGSSKATARKLAENIERIETLGKRLMSALSTRPMPNPGIEAPGPDLLMTAANAWMKTLS